LTKNSVTIVLSGGSLTSWRILGFCAAALNLSRNVETSGRAGTLYSRTGEPDMPKAARISAAISASSASSKSSESVSSSSEQSEGHPLVSIALFCGIGLLVSLVSILVGLQGGWY
jgi:hypothetical protein